MIRTRSCIQVAARLTGLIVIAVALSACAGGKTTVMKPPTEKFTVASVEVVEQTTTVEVPAEVRNDFQILLNDKLFDKDGFAKGNELKLTYTFVQFEPGNRATRYVLGGWGSMGKGYITILARFHDASDREIATIRAKSEIDTRVMGGSLNSALKKAAEEIAQYTKSNFHS